jgi:hypothetical protein
MFLGGCAPVTYVQEPAPVYVQGPPPSPRYYPESQPQAAAATPLDQLMAPVALYPDPLISIILPAATFPSDVAAAGAYLNGGGDLGQVDSQPWDPSVRSLAHYPEVAEWMAQNGSWTQTVGAEFISQPSEVMGAIQRLRELASAAGTLTDNREQQVIVEDNFVEIEPAEPGVIYVPRYDPEVVFVDQPYYGYGGPFLTYGPAYGAGVWLTFGCNWQGGGIMIVDEYYWHRDGGWWHPYGPGPGRGEFVASVNARPWSFPANRPRPQAPGGWQRQAQTVHPRPIAGSPAQPPQSAFRNIHTRGPAAVAVVARDPAAFKGKPINSAIIAKPAGSPSQKGPSVQSGHPAAIPQAPAKLKAEPAKTERPAAVQPREVEAAPRKEEPAKTERPAAVQPRENEAPSRKEEADKKVDLEKTPATPAPESRAEKGNAGNENNPANGKKIEKPVPKKQPKPEPKEEEKPKEQETPR